ncbi:MAG: hypothetical protein O3C23_02775 [bacterium]|nr:hypothetical protein [bacterium]
MTSSKQEASTVSIEVPSSAICEDKKSPNGRHYWVIQPANGPTSDGKCQFCKETRDFKNFVESESRGNSSTKNRPRRSSADEEDDIGNIDTHPDDIDEEGFLV